MGYNFLSLHMFYNHISQTTKTCTRDESVVNAKKTHKHCHHNSVIMFGLKQTFIDTSHSSHTNFFFVQPKSYTKFSRLFSSRSLVIFSIAVANENNSQVSPSMRPRQVAGIGRHCQAFRNVCSTRAYERTRPISHRYYATFSFFRYIIREVYLTLLANNPNHFFLSFYLLKLIYSIGAGLKSYIKLIN